MVLPREDFNGKLFKNASSHFEKYLGGLFHTTCHLEAKGCRVSLNMISSLREQKLAENLGIKLV